MRRAERSPLRFWAGIVLLVCLVAGLTADAFGGCGTEGWDEVGSTAVCLHPGDVRSDSERPHPGNTAHHGSNCICPCHGLVLTCSPEASDLPASSTILSCTHPSLLLIVDLPTFLRPPIAG